MVESGGNRVGVVDRLRYGSHGGIPDFLIVRAGRLGRQRVMISVGDVREIVPREKRILLRPTWMTIKM